MRISTGMVYAQGIGTIQKQQADVLKTQQQVSTGRRILAPSDDPVSSSSVLELTQYMNVNEQNGSNANVAMSKLQMEETALTDIGNLIQDVKNLAVNAGNGALSASDRNMLATELQNRYQALLGLSNATDENGQYMFSGYMGGTAPFSETTPGNVVYNGDQGQRGARIGARRQVAVSDSGADVFQRIKNGNGVFVTTATKANAAAGTVDNTGSGVISPGNVLDKAKWNDPTNNKDFTVIFDVSNTIPAVTTYDIIDNVAGISLLTGAGPTGVGPYPRTYTSGGAISLKTVAPPDTNPVPFDFGTEFDIAGAPATGDTFAVKASTNEDVFKTLSNLLDVLTKPPSVAVPTALQNGLNTAMSNLDNALDNILTVRASIGARMKEVDSMQGTRADLTIQFQATISRLQDVDYAETISNLTLQQTHLEAAQKSFVSTQSLTLFNYIK